MIISVLSTTMGNLFVICKHAPCIEYGNLIFIIFFYFVALNIIQCKFARTHKNEVIIFSVLHFLRWKNEIRVKRKLHEGNVFMLAFFHYAN